MKRYLNQNSLDKNMDNQEEKELKETVSEEIKQKIFKLISTPGVEIEDIVKDVRLDYETVMEILSEEYLKNNLGYGRRLCCRFS